MHIAYYSVGDKVVTVNEYGALKRMHANTNNIRMVLIHDNLIEICNKTIEKNTMLLDNLKKREIKRKYYLNLNTLVLLMLAFICFACQVSNIVYYLALLSGVELALLTYNGVKKSKNNSKINGLSAVIKMANIKKCEFEEKIKLLKKEGYYNNTNTSTFKQVNDVDYQNEFNEYLNITYQLGAYPILKTRIGKKYLLKKENNNDIMNDVSHNMIKNDIKSLKRIKRI